MYRTGCNFVFLDHRPKEIVEEKLRFYKEIFPDRKFGLIYNLPIDLQLSSDLQDITVTRLPSGSPLRGYTAASLWAVEQFPVLAASPDFRGRPTTAIECDLEISRADYEARVFSVLSAPSSLEYGASCWTAVPPVPQLFHGGDLHLFRLFGKAFGVSYPKVASTLGSFVLTTKGADAILSVLSRPAVRAYHNYLVDVVKLVESGRRRIIYASHYFTDYAFPLALQISGLGFAECVNRVNPKVPTDTHQSGAAQTNTPLSREEFEWMSEDERYYVIHHLATDKDRFPGASECTKILRQKLRERTRNA